MGRRPPRPLAKGRGGAPPAELHASSDVSPAGSLRSASTDTPGCICQQPLEPNYHSFGWLSVNSLDKII